MTPRQAAKSQGLKMFFTGKPCKHGHIAMRYVLSGSCSECGRDWNNDDRHRLQCKQWRKDHKSRVRELNDRWADYRREVTRRWCERNPEKVSLSWRTSGARRRNAPGSHTGTDILDILKSQKGRCAYCRKKMGGNYHVDHIVAVARGGTNDKRNLQALCPPCNLKKHARDPIEFAQAIGLLV